MMKRVMAALGVLMFSACAIAAQQNGAWVKYESTEGRYTISMPKKPSESGQDTTAKTGETLKQYLAMAMDGEAVFLAGYMDMTPGMTFNFDEGKTAMARGMNATAGDSRLISLGGAPGREYELTGLMSNDVAFIDYVRTYQVGQRIYVLQHLIPASEKGAATSAKTSKFFDSFSVVTPK